mmetsp:Transcript_29115/g.53104  ORF Transcript_29115/g.53104 Transcript_29115/m.53104 type:complete len:223 (-) Transcript_29115:42-710(-)
MSVPAAPPAEATGTGPSPMVALIISTAACSFAAGPLTVILRGCPSGTPSCLIWIEHPVFSCSSRMVSPPRPITRPTAACGHSTTASPLPAAPAAGNPKPSGAPCSVARLGSPTSDWRAAGRLGSPPRAAAAPGGMPHKAAALGKPAGTPGAPNPAGTNAAGKLAQAEGSHPPGCKAGAHCGAPPTGFGDHCCAMSLSTKGSTSARVWQSSCGWGCLDSSRVH